jgi:2-oxoglutarate ferredoxin oxidoreductase subunit gamma
MPVTEIRVAGFGGQGVILAAMVIGKAHSVFEGAFATLTQSFGPEARGGACSAQVITSDNPVLYPYVTRPDILVVMSQEAFTKFLPDLKQGGTLVAEADMVQLANVKPGTKVFTCPATRIAEELGKRMVLNIVMVGFFAAVTEVCQPESLRKAVADSVPPAFKELNLKAFDKGFEYGSRKLELSPEGEEQLVATGDLEGMD